MARKKISVNSPITWILVADTSRAQVYMRQRIEKFISPATAAYRNHFEEVIAHAPVAVTGMKWVASSWPQYTKPKGSTDEPDDAQDEVRMYFAKEIAVHINRAKTKKLFDRLVLVAEPKMLEELKKCLNANVRKCIVAEMPKELAHYEAAVLTEHLGGVA